MARKFEYSFLEKEDYDSLTRARWSFSNAMVGACRPAFDDCESNHEVEDKLRKAGVIHKKTKTDTESCQLWVYFSGYPAACNFIDRLNAYLREKEKKMKEARAF
jgi:hypothetical protein